MARPFFLGRWMSDSPAIAAGALMSGIFFLVGVAGCLAFGPTLLEWRAAAAWPTAPAEITASRLLSGIEGRTVRPDFSFRYTWGGQVRMAAGFDLLGVYTSDRAGVQQVLDEHPVGSQTMVLVNPRRPDQAVLVRGATSSLLIFLVPPLFAVLGLIGGAFTLAGWLGWIAPESRHPVGRMVRGVGGVVLRESVLKTLFYVIFCGTIVAVAWIGVVWSNPLLIGTAVVLGWGLWIASRKRPGSEDD